MAIFGFIALCALALYLSFAGIAALLVSNGFTGKTDKISVVLLAAAGAAWYFIFTNAPFTIKML